MYDTFVRRHNKICLSSLHSLEHRQSSAARARRFIKLSNVTRTIADNRHRKRVKIRYDDFTKTVGPRPVDLHDHAFGVDVEPFTRTLESHQPRIARTVLY